MESRTQDVQNIFSSEIVNEIDDHVRKCGGAYSAWYCGIAADPRGRLFSDHQVNQKKDAWIFRDCGSDDAARKVEAPFQAKGCQGAGSGGDGDTHFVYAYKITDQTCE